MGAGRKDSERIVGWLHKLQRLLAALLYAPEGILKKY